MDKQGKVSKADICLIIEGAYPYVQGGVATWTHDLINEQKERTFSILSIMPPYEKPVAHYKLPDNVCSLKTIFLQSLPKKGSRWQRLAKQLEPFLYQYLMANFEQEFDGLLGFFQKHRSSLGRKNLIESKAAWEVFISLYKAIQPAGPFLDFFWSVVVMSRALYSILLPPMPEARLYHALSTGYSGIMLARAKKEKKVPCFLTEHGLYTTERRIEIAVSDWFGHPESLNLSFDAKKYSLRDFWLNAFLNSAKLCYSCADEIVTLFAGNKDIQVSQGADARKIHVIPNGINFERFSCSVKNAREHPPTIALIGRVVPIKDTKTFIRAVRLLKQRLPEARGLIIGPYDEQPDYYKECRTLVELLKLEQDCLFLGKVNLTDYLAVIDVNVLTSLSESQPLVLLEAGAAGIPAVATKVGSCTELIEGREDEMPPLGKGGIIVPLSNPRAVADAAFRLLTNRNLYAACGLSIKTRVETFYQKQMQHSAYRNLYTKHLG